MLRMLTGRSNKGSLKARSSDSNTAASQATMMSLVWLFVLSFFSIAAATDITLASDNATIGAVTNGQVQDAFFYSCEEMSIGVNSFTFRNSLLMHLNASNITIGPSIELYPCGSRALSHNVSSISPNTTTIEIECSVYDGKTINFTMLVKFGREIFSLHLTKVCPICPLDCHAPNGSCIDGLCACNPNFFGACPLEVFTLSWGRAAVSVVTPTATDWLGIYNTSLTVGEYDGTKLSSDLCLNYIVWYYYVPSGAAVSYGGSRNFTQDTPRNLTFFFLSNDGCQYIAKQDIEILPSNDARCISPLATTSSCPLNCSNQGSCICTPGSSCFCECSDGFFGSDCSYGCPNKVTQKLSAHSGIIGTNTSPYQYLPNTMCTWDLHNTEPYPLQLTFQYINLDNLEDLITIKFTDDDGRIVTESYGYMVSPFIVSRNVTVTFFSDNYSEGRGFSMSFVSQGCHAGNFIDTDLQCKICPPGTYSNSDNSRHCTVCPVGTYASQPGTVKCSPCDFATYQPNEKSVSCTSCPTNKRSIDRAAISVDQCVCEEGTYAINSSLTVPCVPCPDGANCTGGIAVPVAEVGYWNSEVEPTEFFLCVSELFCPGAGPNCTVNCCNQGYEGDLCAQCSNGWYRVSNSCKGLLGFILTIGLYHIISAPPNNPYWKSAKSSLSIFLAFLQLVSLFSKLAKEYPAFLIVFFNGFSQFTINFDTFAPGCMTATQNALYHYALLNCLPFIFLLFCVVMKVGSEAYNWLSRRFLVETIPTRTGWMKRQLYRLLSFNLNVEIDHLINMCLLVFDMVFVIVCENVFDAYFCYHNTDGTTSLYADPRVRCFEGHWNVSYLPLSVFFIIIYVIGFLSTTIFAISQYRQKNEDSRFMKRFGFLFDRFNKESFYWNLSLIFRRACVTFAILTIQNHPVRFVVTFVIITVFATAHTWAFPFKDSAVNWLETFLQGVLLVLLGMTSMYVAVSPPVDVFRNDSAYYWIPGIMLFLVIIGSLAAVVVNVYLVYKAIQVCSSKTSVADSAQLYYIRRNMKVAPEMDWMMNLMFKAIRTPLRQTETDDRWKTYGQYAFGQKTWSNPFEGLYDEGRRVYDEAVVYGVWPYPAQIEHRVPAPSDCAVRRTDTHCVR
ncbi:mastigoneme-like protein [Planoprotostelium fungivorum]|uniref:Mastigoneme-like protein n=1 Tax=Planoprotostelium fungivorum TaxID=1890364 RepID=A0A2P6NQI7_9EUKA|nr:mastigoneme-like protein [Planoprotostelium fungivorum]